MLWRASIICLIRISWWDLWNRRGGWSYLCGSRCYGGIRSDRRALDVDWCSKWWGCFLHNIQIHLRSEQFSEDVLHVCIEWKLKKSSLWDFVFVIQCEKTEEIKVCCKKKYSLRYFWDKYNLFLYTPIRAL